MKYYLAEACRNTFILFDCLESVTVDKEFLSQARRCLEKEQRDDALILLAGNNQENRPSARMLVLGLDGSLGEFCGNGARACAAYLFSKYPQSFQGQIETYRGMHTIMRHGENIYSIKVPRPNFAWNEKFILNQQLFKEIYPNLHYVETIEPHLIIEASMGDEELLALGRELNKHKDLFPLGINVNAWHPLKKGHLYVKTYERGVQRLTQSCGSGSMACAAFYQRKGQILISTPGGQLEVIWEEDEIELRGPAFYNEKIGKAD